MPDNALVPAQQTNQTMVVFTSVRNLDHDAIMAKLDAEMPAFESTFPGDPLTFDGKRGKWRWGHGSKGIAFDHNAFSFVMNIPNAVEGWQRFIEDPVSGKLRPLIVGMVPVCDPSAKLVDRKSLGDTDTNLWPTDNWGKKQDPWKHFIAIPLRTDGQQQVNHLFVATISTTISVKGLIREFVEGSRGNMGKLPVVNVGVTTRKNNNGEDFDVPTFTIVDWDVPLPVDEPNADEQTAAQVAIPEATVTTVGKPDAGASSPLQFHPKPGHDEFGMPLTQAELAQQTAPVQTTVQQLQAQAQQTAAAERRRTAETVQTIAQQTGATQAQPAGQRRGAAPAAGVVQPAKSDNLFAGGRRSARATAKV